MADALRIGLMQRLLQLLRDIGAESGRDQLLNQPLHRWLIHVQQRQQAAVFRQLTQMIQPQQQHLTRILLRALQTLTRLNRRFSRALTEQAKFKSAAKLIFPRLNTGRIPALQGGPI